MTEVNSVWEYLKQKFSRKKRYDICSLQSPSCSEHIQVKSTGADTGEEIDQVLEGECDLVDADTSDNNKHGVTQNCPTNLRSQSESTMEDTQVVTMQDDIEEGKHDITEEECDFVQKDITTKHKPSKRFTCSVDLSDKTLRLINSQQLTSVDGVCNVHRTASFNLDQDFPMKMLPITDFVEKEVLGEGAFGRAIKVEHIKSGYFFVLKEVVSHSKENAESIIREVALLRSWKHNNILSTIGLVLKDKSICLLTELMDGGSLQSKILNLNDHISVHQKLSFLRDIAAGMTFLHQHSIMHRDLTSTNCLLRKDNTVVVSDFGLSKFLNDDNERNNHSSVKSLTRKHIKSVSTSVDIQPTKIRSFRSVGDVSSFKEEKNNHLIPPFIGVEKRNMKLRRKHTVVGNPFWMAPEMLADKYYNCQVDIYSFGIIGCEVTARVSAHPDFLKRIHKDMSVDFDDFIEKHTSLELCTCPDELIDLVHKCCDIDPDNRPIFDLILSRLEDILFRIMNNVNLKMNLLDEE